MTKDMKQQEKEDFEQGRKDGEKGLLGRLVADLPGNHPNNEAYYAGRNTKPSPKREEGAYPTGENRGE